MISGRRGGNEKEKECRMGKEEEGKMSELVSKGGNGRKQMRRRAKRPWKGEKSRKKKINEREGDLG